MEKKDSKTALLYSAFKEFAQNGFWGATTRDIAGRANINISSILYYFGGKKGIYTAALNNIVDTVNAKTQNLTLRYEEVIKHPKDYQGARELLKDSFNLFLELICGEELSKDMKTVFLSEYSRPTEDFNILYDGLILPFHKRMSDLMVQAGQGKISLQDAYLYTFPIFAQLFVFSSRKETICKFMNWTEYTQEEIKRLQSYMQGQIEALLDRQGSGNL